MHLQPIILCAIIVALICAVFAYLRLITLRGHSEVSRSSHWQPDVALVAVEVWEQKTTTLLDEFASSAANTDFVARNVIRRQISQHLEALEEAIWQMPLDASHLFLDYGDLRTNDEDLRALSALSNRLVICKRGLEGVIAADALLFRQQQDLNSYTLRADLHLTNLAKARTCPVDHQRVQATLSMVHSFAESASLFSLKWTKQYVHLSETFPELELEPFFTHTADLRQLPLGLQPVQDMLRKAILESSPNAAVI